MELRIDCRRYLIAATLIMTAVATVVQAASPTTISGTVHLPPELASHVAATDRMILKSFHPGPDGLEMDPRYRIFTAFEFPYEFDTGPNTDMSGQTKHQTYKIQVFTDKNSDLGSIVAGELEAITDDVLPLGSENVSLELRLLK